MGTVVKADPENPGALLRDEVPDSELGQDTAAEHAAKMAAPKPKTLIERLADLEADMAELKRPKP